MLISLFGKPVFWLLKTILKPVFGFTDLHKSMLLCKANNFMYYILCTCKAVSTPIWSFLRFSLNEVKNIVYTVFYRKNFIKVS